MLTAADDALLFELGAAPGEDDPQAATVAAAPGAKLPNSSRRPDERLRCVMLIFIGNSLSVQAVFAWAVRRLMLARGWATRGRGTPRRSSLDADSVSVSRPS
jgi:hypothetical protein